MKRTAYVVRLGDKFLGPLHDYSALGDPRKRSFSKCRLFARHSDATLALKSVIYYDKAWEAAKVVPVDITLADG